MCDLCNFKKITNHGVIRNFSFGWTVYLSNDNKLIVGHNNEKIEVPFIYCPICGRKLDEIVKI